MCIFICNKTTFYAHVWTICTFLILFLFLTLANPAYQHIIQNQQYTPNYQHQHPPHQQSHYNGSNQFEQQHAPPPHHQQQNTNFIHSVSSSQQQHQPHRGDNGLSASVVRRQKRPTTNVGKLQQVMDNGLK